jgi:sarcosine oxidase subunit gamma
MVEVSITSDPYPGRAIVRLRVAMADAAIAANALRLAPALTARDADDWMSLWLGPDQWLLVSDRVPAHELVARCTAALGDRLHLAVEATSAWFCATLSGARTRDLLAMGSGLDWSVRAMPAGRCVRTRFARIGAVCHATAEHRFDVYVDRSHRHYLDRWLSHAIDDPLLREN